MNINKARELYKKSPKQLLIESCPTANSISDFIKQYGPKAVIGLSGGVDSALVAALAVKALGKDNVYGLMMPANSQNIDVNYAVSHAGKLGIEYRVIDQLPAIIKACKYNNTFFDDPLDEGNLKARLRMVHLYAAARKYQGIVLGTGNKSEDMIGYFTKYGDGGVDILPIAQLYKTQVWKLAEEVGVPDEIIKRVPTAGLWAGQTDEGELGVKYYDLDRILLGCELGFDWQRIAEIINLPVKLVDGVFQRIAKNKHKIELPPMPPSKFERDGP